MDDVGVKVAGSIYSFFTNNDNLEMLQQLQQLGVNMDAKKTEMGSGNLVGQNFLFTGTLLRLKRSDAESIVEKNGGKILSGVSSKLHYLIVGEDAGSKLEKAKNIPSIKILSEDEFLAMTGNA